MEKISQQTIRFINKKKVFQMISSFPEISRARIAENLELSKATISSLVEQLIEDRLIVETGVSQMNRTGRKSNHLEMNQDIYRFFVVEWKQDQITTSCLNLLFDITETQTVPLSRSRSYVENVLDICQGRILQLMVRYRILGIIHIIPGMIDEPNNQIISYIVPLVNQTCAIHPIVEFFPTIPCALINDTAALAYAERFFDSHDSDNFLFVNISDGVGASYWAGDHLLGGASGLTTQFGHCSLDPDGALCFCGGHGCLENEVGEKALRERMIHLAGNGHENGSTQFTFLHLAKLADANNESAIALIDTLAKELSVPLSALITTLYSDQVVLGGSITALGRPFVSSLERYITKTGFQPFISRLKISVTNLDENAIFKGASKYFIDNMFDFGNPIYEQIFMRSR